MNKKIKMLHSLLDSGFSDLDSRSGQSMAELLIAITLGVILVGTAASLILPALRTNTQATNIQRGAALGNGLLDNVRVWSEGNWNSLLALATGSANTYFLETSSSPFIAATGIESILSSSSVATSSVTFVRYFYVSDAYRNASGTIVSTPGIYDPSVKEITVGYSWPGEATQTISTYLTRNRNFVLDQTDWSGGTTPSGTVQTTTNSQFATSSNIDYATTTGSFYLSIPGY